MVEVDFQIKAGTVCGLSNCAEPKQVQQPSKPVMLALHGWLDNAATFEAWVDSELFQDYCFISLDLPGHGHSFHRGTDAHYHFIEYISDVYELIQANGWKDIHLLGHSMGGMIGTALVGTFPELFKSLILIEAIGLVTSDPKDSAENLRNAIKNRHKQVKNGKKLHPDFNSALEARANTADLSAEYLTPIVRRGLVQSENGWQWRADSRLRNHSAMRITPAQVPSFIERIDVPTLLIKGESGFDMVKKGLNDYSHYYQNLVVKQVQGGHHCHLEASDTIAEIINRFLSVILIEVK